MQAQSLSSLTWQELSVPWSSAESLVRLSQSSGSTPHLESNAFYALHKTEGLFHLEDGADNWTHLNEGLPAGIIYHDYTIVPAIFTRRQRIFLATSGGIFRSVGGKPFERASQGLPVGADVISIAWSGYELICGIANRSPHLAGSGDLGDFWVTDPSLFSGFPTDANPKNDPVDIILYPGCFIRTREGVLYGTADNHNWRAVLNGCHSVGIGGAFAFAATKSGKFFVAKWSGGLSSWVERSTNLGTSEVIGLGVTSEWGPLVGAFRNKGVQFLYNWGSSGDLQWDETYNETFPREDMNLCPVYKVAINAKQTVVLALVYKGTSWCLYRLKAQPIRVGDHDGRAKL